MLVQEIGDDLNKVFLLPNSSTDNLFTNHSVTTSSRCWSNAVFILRGPIWGATSSHNGRVSTWRLNSVLSKTVYSKGTDTNQILESSNPLAYPNNGYQGNYWYVMIAE